MNKDLESGIEKLKEYLGYEPYEDETECDYRFTPKEIDALLSALQQPTEWVDVNDRLPDEDGEYVTHNNEDYSEVNTWFIDNNHEDGGYFKYPALAWMQLPSPPTNIILKRQQE